VKNKKEEKKNRKTEQEERPKLPWQTHLSQWYCPQESCIALIRRCVLCGKAYDSWCALWSETKRPRLICLTAPTVVVLSDEASMSLSGGNRKDTGLYACFRPRLLSLTATVGYLEKSHQKV
jgi:hypothetical protein